LRTADGLPSATWYTTRMPGIALSAWTTAHPIMWVKLTFAPRLRARWRFRMLRLVSSSLAGTVRTEVAVGTARDASMYLARVASAPRSGVAPAAGAGGVGEISSAAFFGS